MPTKDPTGSHSGAEPCAFDRATSLERLASGHYAALLDPAWNVFRGPNGGYLAALMLRALHTQVTDPERQVRVLTLHYPAVPKPGPVEILTSLERVGRSVTWVSAELLQEGRLCLAARAAFSLEWPSVQYDVLAKPAMPPPEEGLALVGEGLPPITHHFDYRSLYATPFSRGDAVGGYIRLREPRAYDASVLTAMTDAWFPSAYAHQQQPVMGATLDLSVHFRKTSVLRDLQPTDFVLSVMRSRLASEGFFEEDGEIWSTTGELLAQSRQLAIAAPIV